MSRCEADIDIPTAEHREPGTLQDAQLINKHKHDAGIYQVSSSTCVQVGKACA